MSKLAGGNEAGWEVGDEVELGHPNPGNEGWVREVRDDGIVIVWPAYVGTGLRGYPPSDGSGLYTWETIKFNKWTPRKIQKDRHDPCPLVIDNPEAIHAFAMLSIYSRLGLEARGIKFRVNTGPIAREILNKAGRNSPRNKARLQTEFGQYLKDVRILKTDG